MFLTFNKINYIQTVKKDQIRDIQSKVEFNKVRFFLLHFAFIYLLHLKNESTRRVSVLHLMNILSIFTLSGDHVKWIFGPIIFYSYVLFIYLKII